MLLLCKFANKCQDKIDEFDANKVFQVQANLTDNTPEEDIKDSFNGEVRYILLTVKFSWNMITSSLVYISQTIV